MSGKKTICSACKDRFKSIQVHIPVEPIDYHKKLIQISAKTNEPLSKIIREMIIEGIETREIDKREEHEKDLKRLQKEHFKNIQRGSGINN